MAQLESPFNRDWVSQVINELIELDINFELVEIEKMSKIKFKLILKDKINQQVLQFRNDKKNKTQYIKHLIHNEMALAEYLAPNELNISLEDKQFIFKCRTNDLNTRVNKPWMYKNIEIFCVSCMNINQPETQQHILQCPVLLGKNEIISYIPEYSEIYSTNIDEVVYAAQILKENMKHRDLIMDEYLKA